MAAVLEKKFAAYRTTKKLSGMDSILITILNLPAQELGWSKQCCAGMIVIIYRPSLHPAPRGFARVAKVAEIQIFSFAVERTAKEKLSVLLHKQKM